MPPKKGVKSTIEKEPKKVAEDDPDTTDDDNADIENLKRVQREHTIEIATIKDDHNKRIDTIREEHANEAGILTERIDRLV